MGRAADPLSLRAYAKRRGVSAEAVSQAIKSGRLVASVVRDGKGRPKISDPDLADHEWEAGTDLSKAPGAVKQRADGAASAPERPRPADEFDDETFAHTGMSLGAATAAEKVWKAKLAELAFKEKTGELVAASEVEKKLTNAFTTCRTKLLGVPSRAKQRLPHLSAKDLVALDDLIRESLEELSSTTVRDEAEA